MRLDSMRCEKNEKDKIDVIQRVATGETTAHGTVEVDVYGTAEQCTGKLQSCSTYAHNLNRLVEVVVNN